MNQHFAALITLFSLCAPSFLQAEGNTMLTIYNQNFAVVRESIPLFVKNGIVDESYSETTSLLEPDSVILRDPSGKASFQILEQSFRADPISEGVLLMMNEGKVVDFLISENGRTERKKGKILRSGYSSQPIVGRVSHHNISNMEPIIEMDGLIRFGLPGTPLFPALDDPSILRPTLSWKIQAKESKRLQAELAYISRGLSWNATYNLVAPEKGSKLHFVGWITAENYSGKSFQNTSLKLLAGDVNKIQDEYANIALAARTAMSEMADTPSFEEKSFDDYHLYTLNRKLSLRDRETKQLEFIRADQVESKMVYVYEGSKERRGIRRSYEHIRTDPNFGTQSNTKVSSIREFTNSKKAGLGIPLPKGTVRFYRKDSDGALEFVGENQIDHTPVDEVVRVYTGSLFDVVGERTQTEYHVDRAKKTLRESFEIALRNQRSEEIQIFVRERMYREKNWKILSESSAHQKLNFETIEFPVLVPARGQTLLKYTVGYSW